MYVLHALQKSTNPVIKSLKEFDAQKHENLENILGGSSTRILNKSTLPIILSVLGVLQRQDKYKEAYVGCVLSSEDFFRCLFNFSQRLSTSWRMVVSSSFKLWGFIRHQMSCWCKNDMSNSFLVCCFTILTRPTAGEIV